MTLASTSSLPSRPSKPPGVHRGLPSPCLTVVVALDEGLDVIRRSAPAQQPAVYGVLVGGLHTAPVLLRHSGGWEGVQLSLTPLGARALLGLPAGELAHLDVSGDEVWGPAAVLLREQLLGLPGWPARFAALERWLVARLRSAGWPPELRYAWTLLLRSRGRVPVARVAAEVGWSPRRLGQVFDTEVGLSPKVSARVVRLDRARRTLSARARAGAPLDLAGLTAAGG